MKKLIFFASLLAFAVGCNKVENSAPELSKAFTLTSEISQTKVAVDDAGLMTWQEGDTISVFGHAANGSIIGPVSADLQSGAGTSTGKFALSIDGTPEVAVYPAGGHGLQNGGVVLVSLPAKYEYADSVTNAPMIAKITSSMELSEGTAVFKHVGGLVRVTYENVPAEAKSFSLTATTGITGPFITNVNGAEDAIITANENFGNTVTISFTEADRKNTMSFYVPLPCGQYGFTVALIDAAGNPIEGSSKSVNSANVTRRKFFKTPTIVLEEEVITSKSGMIKFGTNDVKINSASVTGDDDLGNTWTITTVGTTSFTTNADYYQVGSSKNSATSINFTTSLPAIVKITSFSAKFGGFNDTAGDIALKVNDVTVGSGTLNATNDVTVTSTKSAEGENLTVSITGIAKGVKCYYISYTYEAAGTDSESYTVTVDSNITNGTVTANPTSAAEGAEVTLTATPATGYEFGSWNVTNASTSEAIIVSDDNKFTMPAANVSVSAIFNALPTRPENEIFYESFDTNDGTGGNDGQWNGTIASSDIKQDNEGWEYVKGTGANQCAKFGTASALGSAITPALGESCDATLTFKAAAWDYDKESVTLKLSVEGSGIVSPATVILTKGAWNTFTATLTGLSADSKVKFEGNSASNSRFFLDEVSVVKTGEATTPEEPTTYTITVADDIANGTVTASSSSAAEGTEITLTATPADGYELDLWNVTDASSNVISVANNKFTMPASDVTISATFKEIQTIKLENLGVSLSSTSNEAVSTVDITATGTSGSYTLNYLQGKKQGSAILLAKSKGAFISNKTPMPGNIKSVTVYINSGASGSTTYHCAFSSTECTEAYTTGSTAVNIVGGASNKYNCSVEGAKYFCISLGNANNGQVLSIDVECE